jgi:hypothetical protein
MGVSMPALGLIEMHMPVEMIGEDDKIQRPTRADLEDYLGAMYVAAHEAAGHATDTTGEVVYLVPAGPEEFRHYRTTNVWADRAREAFNTTPNVDARGPRELDVTVHAQTDDNRNEEIVPVTEHVSTRSGDDPRLRMSHHAVLLDRKPTRYASDSPGELYGEIAGQVVSGAPIPYSEAALVVNAPHPRLGRGYAVDPNLRQLLIDRTGWDPETARPVNENEFTLTTAEDDPMLGPWIDEARRTPMPDDRITILAGVVGLEN